MLFESALETVARLRERFEIPILVTHTGNGSYPDSLTSLIDQRIKYERTQFRPRLVGDEFETLVYPVCGETIQTPLAFGAEVLATRHETMQRATPELLVHAAD